jgi:hypothetical protein
MRKSTAAAYVAEHKRISVPGLSARCTRHPGSGHTEQHRKLRKLIPDPDPATEMNADRIPNLDVKRHLTKYYLQYRTVSHMYPELQQINTDVQFQFIPARRYSVKDLDQTRTSFELANGSGFRIRNPVKSK